MDFISMDFTRRDVKSPVMRNMKIRSGAPMYLVDRSHPDIATTDMVLAEYWRMCED